MMTTVFATYVGVKYNTRKKNKKKSVTFFLFRSLSSVRKKRKGV